MPNLSLWHQFIGVVELAAPAIIIGAMAWGAVWSERRVR